MENKTVFVCFVHNNFDDLCGEDDISCLMVTDNQKEIDEWLEKQFAEAEENGYFSDEDISTFKGRFDYTVTVSKGNADDGYDSYFFFCTCNYYFISNFFI